MKREKHYPDKTQCQRKKVRMVDVSQVDLNKIKFGSSKYNMSAEELKKVIKLLYEEALKQCEIIKHSLKKRAQPYKILDFEIVIDKDEKSGWYMGQCYHLPEAMSQGKTIDELYDNIEEAIELVIESNREKVDADSGPDCKIHKTPHGYTVAVRKDEKNGCYAGQCREIPDAIGLGKTIKELLDNIDCAVGDVYESNKEKVDANYKGRKTTWNIVLVQC